MATASQREVTVSDRARRDDHRRASLPPALESRHVVSNRGGLDVAELPRSSGDPSDARRPCEQQSKGSGLGRWRQGGARKRAVDEATGGVAIVVPRGFEIEAPATG